MNYTKHFEDVIKQWDHLDDNRERKERYHEIGRENIDSRKDVAPLAIVIPAPIDYSYWRQLMKGDFIDIIFNCPFEMHESLADKDYSKIIYKLKDEHKELLYFLYIRDYSTQKLAAMRNQSDRNIRGVRSTVLGRLKRKYFLYWLTDLDRISLLPVRNGIFCPDMQKIYRQSLKNLTS